MLSPIPGPSFFPFSLTQQTLRPTQAPCWTLPTEGFEALLDLENTVVPGLSLLAKDMAKDQKNIISAQRGLGSTRSLAEEISARLCDGAKNHRQQNVVVVPHVAGIIFARLDPATTSTAAQLPGRSTSGSGGRSSSNVSCRATAVLARLEPARGRKTRSMTAPSQQQHQFVLEDLKLSCDDGSGEGGRSKEWRSNMKRRNATKRGRARVSMPVTYAALLEEATSPLPGPGELAVIFLAVGAYGVSRTAVCASFAVHFLPSYAHHSTVL